MPTWGELLKELGRLQRGTQTNQQIVGFDPEALSPHDILRRKYLARLNEKTGRAVIIYASAFLENKAGVVGPDVSVGPGDMQGFMEAVSNITEKEVDLFLHSPGGSPEAAEAIMAYLRTRFDHIRAVVPIMAMSAATMMALACDEILMGTHSQLGPIDPQLTISTPEGPRSAPAQAIIDQFERAKKECQDPANIAAWLPIIRGYGPGLLAICDNSRALSEEFASRNLEKYMFASDPEAAKRSEAAAKWFADHTTFRSHGRRVSRDDARALHLNVTSLEDDQEVQDLVLSVQHAVSLTLAGTPAAKIIENHHGRAYITQKGVQELVLTPGPPPTGFPTPELAPGTGPDPSSKPQVRGGNRAERRRQGRGGDRS